jgi:hypothetical protein
MALVFLMAHHSKQHLAHTALAVMEEYLVLSKTVPDHHVRIQWFPRANAVLSALQKVAPSQMEPLYQKEAFSLIPALAVLAKMVD